MIQAVYFYDRRNELSDKAIYEKSKLLQEYRSHINPLLKPIQKTVKHRS